MERHTEDPCIIFGQNFASLLQRKNLTYKDAAALTGIYRQRIPKLISGSQNFKLNTVIEISKTFNVAPFLLFSRLFDIDAYRVNCTYTNADYMLAIRTNLDRQRLHNVDLNRTALSQLTSINGSRTNPTIETLKKIADGTNSSISELLKLPEDTLNIHIAEGEET